MIYYDDSWHCFANALATFRSHIKNIVIKCLFGKNYFCQFILLFSLFLLLFMGLTALFGTIYGFHCIISINFYLYLQYFQQKFSSFSKINESQMDLKYLPSSQKRPNKKRESILDLFIKPLILKLYIVRK